MDRTPTPSAFVGRAGHRLGLLDAVGQRLLAQDVLAGLQRRDGDLGVGVAGRADVDQVDVVAVDQRLPRALGRLPAEPLSSSATACWSRPATARHPEMQREVEEAWSVAPGLRVGRAHEGVADHPDAQLVAALPVVMEVSSLLR